MGATHTPGVASATPPANIQTKAPFIAFQSGNVPPSQQIYLQLNDAIFIRTMANAVFAQAVARYRYLTPLGEIKEGVLPLNISATIQLFTLPLGEAWLLSILIDPVASAGAGTWIYAQVGIARGLLAAGSPTFQGVVWEGYVTGGELNGWPGASNKQVWDGAGTLRAVTGNTPALGADINEVVPAFRRWQVLAFHAVLTASAAVANRFPEVLIDDGANVLYGLASTTAQTASQVGGYNLAPGLNFFVDGIVDFIIPIPAGLSLKGGFRIRTSTIGIQAGDQWAAPHYLVAEWGAWDA